MSIHFFSRATGAFLCVFGPLSAAVVSGVVTRPGGPFTGQLVVTAVHAATGQRRQATADDAGRYRLENLPAGHYLVSAWSGDQFSAPQSVDLEAASDAILPLELNLEKVRTEVVVTATAAVVSTDTVSRAVDVVDASAWNARGVSALADAVQLIPGVRIQNLGGPGGFTRILIRGLRSQDTAVAIDGLRFRDAASTQGDATTFVENLMPVDTARIEILRGSGSALYGSNAVGGVINMVTDEGSDRWHGGLQGEGGGLGYGRGKLNAGGPLGRWLTFTGGAQHTNVSRGNDGQDPFRNTSGQSALTWRPRTGLAVNGRWFGGDAFVGLNDSPFAAPSTVLPARGVIRAQPVSVEQQHRIEAGQVPLYVDGANLVPNLNDPDSHRASRFSATALVVTEQLAHGLSYRASYQNTATRRRFEDGPAGVRLEPAFRTEDWSRGRIDTAQVRLNWLPTRQWQVGGGYEGEWEDYRGRSTNAAPRPLYFASFAKQHSSAALGYAEGRLFGDHLHVSLAARAQSFRLRTPRFEGGISPYDGVDHSAPPAARTFDGGISWFVARTGTKLRAHAGNGYRAPSMFERFGMSQLNGVFAPNGDPGLRPDRTLSLDAGIDQYLWQQRIRVSATTFYTDLREVIAFDSTGFLTPSNDPFKRSSGYINTAGGIARGVETQAEGTLPGRIRWNAAYTFTNGTQRRSTVRDNDFFQSPFVVRQQFSGSMTVPVAQRFEVTASAWITGKHPAILSRRAFLFEGAQRLDVAASYRMPFEAVAMRLNIRATNVLNAHYLENGFRTPGFWATAGFSVTF